MGVVGRRLTLFAIGCAALACQVALVRVGAASVWVVPPAAVYGACVALLWTRGVA